MDSVSTRVSPTHLHLTHHQPLLASSLDAAAGRLQILAMHCQSTAMNAMQSVAMRSQTNMVTYTRTQSPTHTHTPSPIPTLQSRRWTGSSRLSKPTPGRHLRGPSRMLRAPLASTLLNYALRKTCWRPRLVRVRVGEELDSKD